MATTSESIVTHTAGPWHIEPAPSPSSMKSVRNEAGKAIAFVNRGPAAEANERLIAAAPELLAEAKAAMEFITECDLPRSPWRQSLEDKLADVIAKATGSQS